jgi:hypothetical protein
MIVEAFRLNILPTPEADARHSDNTLADLIIVECAHADAIQIRCKAFDEFEEMI